MLRRYLFINTLHPVLSTAMGRPENSFISYTASNFIDFLRQKVTGNVQINYLRAYFAAIEGRLQIVYATNDPSRPKEELYYMLETNTFKPLGHDEALGFVRAYRNNKLPVLNSVINPIKGNTICVKHDPKHILELINEIDCQKVSGIKAYFASYLNAEPMPHGELSSRLHIEFVLTEKTDPGGIEYDFYIDDCANFAARPLSDATHFNNGTLCPPCTGCDNEVTLDPISCP